MEQMPSRDDSRWLAYLQLFRAPNVFTAIADVAMGFFVTTNALEPWPGLLLLILASAFLYSAGMVLNDVFDVSIDAQERPQRPLPSGRISWTWARWLGAQMLLMGVACAWLAGLSSRIALGPWWRSGLVAIVLALAVLLYDGWAKKTSLGPWVMGSCRALNVLLGMSLNAAVTTDEPHWLGFGTSHLMIAAGIGLYIVGVTWFARSEVTVSPRLPLTIGVLLMIVGLVTLAAFPSLHPNSFLYRFEPGGAWPLGVALIAIWILRRPIIAIRDPSPRQVQPAVKNCILSLIILDALVCSLISELPFAIGIVALLAPTLMLGRWVYST